MRKEVEHVFEELSVAEDPEFRLVVEDLQQAECRSQLIYKGV
jgi:hypothetical protein